MRRHDSAGGAIPFGWVEVGTVIKPHGIRGAVRIRLHNPTSTSIAGQRGDMLALLDSAGNLVSKPKIIGRRAGTVAVAIPGTDSRAAAERLRGARLLVRRCAIRLEQDEYLVVDLIGCAVHERDRCFGVVADVVSTGASDVLVVRDGRKERLIPLVDDWVVDVDTRRKAIQIHGGDQWEVVELSGLTPTRTASESGAVRASKRPAQ